jgi:hypothetical protein
MTLEAFKTAGYATFIGLFALTRQCKPLKISCKSAGAGAPFHSSKSNTVRQSLIRRPKYRWDEVYELFRSHNPSYRKKFNTR